jgi:threonylcarbamoyladenosine tRNA methylthiotransferase MtaB
LLHYGCKVNQYETNAMEQEFANKGYTILKPTQKADIYVINTCTVTNIAERKSRQMLRRVKQINEDAVLVVCGCYAEVAREELANINEIDLILNSKEKKNIVEIVEKFEKDGQRNTVDENETLDEFVDFGSVTYTEKNRAVIKVQDGCNMFCTYCIIPYARGRIRSRKIDSVVKEITDIAKTGIKEVVITGIHVASYGKDWDEQGKKQIRLIDLLEEINKIDGIERIRLGSLEPTLITEEFLQRLTKLEKVCDHFHLSLQSGCDATLKRMNRKYTTSQFKEITARLKKAYPEVSLTTDIIVGFPGETDEEFEKTYKFLKEINFYKMHVFKYSPRKGTPAAKMINQVDGNIKEQRSRKLIDLSNKNENMHNEQYIGKDVDVLFEEFEKGYFRGHTANYIVVNVKGEEKQKNEFVNKIKTVRVLENNTETRELIAE